MTVEFLTCSLTTEPLPVCYCAKCECFSCEPLSFSCHDFQICTSVDGLGNAAFVGPPYLVSTQPMWLHEKIVYPSLKSFLCVLSHWQTIVTDVREKLTFASNVSSQIIKVDVSPRTATIIHKPYKPCPPTECSDVPSFASHGFVATACHKKKWCVTISALDCILWGTHYLERPNLTYLWKAFPKLDQF